MLAGSSELTLDPQQCLLIHNFLCGGVGGTRARQRHNHQLPNSIQVVSNEAKEEHVCLETSK